MLHIKEGKYYLLTYDPFEEQLSMPNGTLVKVLAWNLPFALCEVYWIPNVEITTISAKLYTFISASRKFANRALKLIREEETKARAQQSSPTQNNWWGGPVMMRTVLQTRCPECDGSLIERRDPQTNGWYISCTNCGEQV